MPEAGVTMFCNEANGPATGVALVLSARAVACAVAGVSAVMLVGRAFPVTAVVAASGKSPNAANCVNADEVGGVDVRGDEVITALFKACITGSATWANSGRAFREAKAGFDVAEAAFGATKAVLPAGLVVPAIADGEGALSPNSFWIAASSKPIDWANAVKLSALGVPLGVVMMCICGLSATARKFSEASVNDGAEPWVGMADGMAIMAT